VDNIEFFLATDYTDCTDLTDLLRNSLCQFMIFTTYTSDWLDFLGLSTIVGKHPQAPQQKMEFLRNFL
jgi:hypothetical protein